MFLLYITWMLRLPDNRFDLYQPWCEGGVVDPQNPLTYRELEEMISYTVDLNDVVRATFKRPELHIKMMTLPQKYITLEFERGTKASGYFDSEARHARGTVELHQSIKLQYPIPPHYRVFALFYLNHNLCEYQHVMAVVNANAEELIFYVKEMFPEQITPFTALESHCDDDLGYAERDWFFDNHLNTIRGMFDWDKM